MIELPVSPETAPYLVSTSKGTLWVDHTSSNGFIRAAVRPGCKPGDLFREALEQIKGRGMTDSWGNVHTFTEDGVQGAIDHVAYYGLTDIELMVAPKRTKKGTEGGTGHPEWLKKWGVHPHPSSWVPDNCVVVLPKNREYVGVLRLVSPRCYAMVVHNASRGVGIAWGP